MMEPSESLARQARQQYGMNIGYQPSWIPFLPPFAAYDEVPPTPIYMHKNPVHDSEWEKLDSEQETDTSMQR